MDGSIQGVTFLLGSATVCAGSVTSLPKEPRVLKVWASETLRGSAFRKWFLVRTQT